MKGQRSTTLNRRKTVSISWILIPAILIVLIGVCAATIWSSGNTLKQEVLDQWAAEESKLVDAYKEVMHERGCKTVEEYQGFIDEINSKYTFNYCLYLREENGEVKAIAHSNPDRVGITLTDAGSIAAASKGEAYAGYYTDQVTGGLTLDILTPDYDANGNLLGALNFGVPIDDATMDGILASAVQKNIKVSVIAIIAAAILIIAAITLLLLVPLLKLIPCIDRIANYDLSDEGNGAVLKYSKRRDEVGAISYGVKTMSDNLKEIIGKVQDSAIELKTQTTQMTEVCVQADDNGKELSNTVSNVAVGASDQAQQSADGNEQMQVLSELIEAVGTKVNKMTELSNAVQKAEEQGQKVLNVLVDKTDENNTSAAQVQKAMEETCSQVEEIKHVCGQIEDISFQTNILALNAAVEAARAGNAGKGFAVVAAEVRTLATKTQELTSQIEEIIHRLSATVNDSKKTVDVMGSVTEQQTKSVSETRSKFMDITTAVDEMQEQCKNLTDAAGQMGSSKERFFSLIAQIAALAEENAACMENAAASVQQQSLHTNQIADAANQVMVMTDSLSAEVEKFSF